MILVDFNQVVISNVMMESKAYNNEAINEDMVRHMVLNSLRSYRTKFFDKYGELVIACDAGNVWRKEVFPYYKANRKKSKEASKINWASLYSCLNNIRVELQENFPYKVVHVDTAEADDVIATLTERFGQELNTGEPILIVSGDEDFMQLQKFGNVDQYNPVRKKWVKSNNPVQDLKEHIIKGCSGDGVPNILSPDDCLVLGIRQATMSGKRLTNYLSNEVSKYDSIAARNFHRNQQLIDLTFVPKDIKDKIIDLYDNQHDNGRSKLMTYFITKKLKNLQSYLGDF